MNGIIGIRRKVDKFLEKWLEVNLIVMTKYIISVIIISILFQVFSGDCLTFIIAAIAAMLGRAIGIFYRKRRNTK